MLTREQELALVQALEHGGPSQAVCPGSEDLWEWSTAACRWFLTPAGKLLAQAIKERDEARSRVAELEAERATAADAWDEGYGTMRATFGNGKGPNPYRGAPPPKAAEWKPSSNCPDCKGRGHVMGGHERNTVPVVCHCVSLTTLEGE